MGVIDSVFLGHEFDIVGILVRAAQCVCVCVCVGGADWEGWNYG